MIPGRPSYTCIYFCSFGLTVRRAAVAIGYLILMRRTRKLQSCAEPQQPRWPPLPLPESAALKALHSPGGAFAFLSHGLVHITPDALTLPGLIQAAKESISAIRCLVAGTHSSESGFLATLSRGKPGGRAAAAIPTVIMNVYPPNLGISLWVGTEAMLQDTD